MSDLCALADVKTYLGYTTTTSDALFSRLITACSAQIEAWCGRVFASAPYIDIQDGDGSDYLILKNRPIISIQSVTLDGDPISASPDGISAGYTFDSTTLYYIGGWFCRGRRNVNVSYTAGFATVPPDIAQAAIALVGFQYNKSRRLDVKSETLAQQTQSFDLSGIPDVVKQVISQYKVTRV